MAELTMQDIKQAMKYIEDTPETIYFEDDFQIIYGKGFYLTKIKLKPKGIEMVNEFCNFGEKLIKDNKIISFFGVDVTTSNEVSNG